MKRIFTLMAIALISVAASAAPKHQVLTSPDGRLSVTVQTGENISYWVVSDGVQVLEPSQISMTLTNGTVYGGAAKLQKVTRRSVNETISTKLYKKSEVKNHFNEMTLRFKAFSVVFRAYDKGIAYRFVSNSKVPFEVLSEQADFVFAPGTKAYIPYVNTRPNSPDGLQFYSSFESKYTYSALEDWDGDHLSIIPIMMEAPQGKKVCIAEADLFNYPGMLVCGEKGTSTLKAAFAPYPKETRQGGHNNLQIEVCSREPYIAKFDKAETLPWRIISVSSNDIEMADNDMVFCLSTAPDPEVDYSWVKPGKVAWEWWNDWNIIDVDFKAGINNDTYKYYIDFASKYGIEYVILDEGWAVNLKADLFQVIPEINLEELVAYAKARNVELILWAGYWAFDRDMEKVCKHYSEMGIKGFKIDFMDRDDQVMVDFHHRAAQVAAKYQMMVDFHGTYKPTGLHRTYPNVINYEGVFGLENMKWEGPLDQVIYDVTFPYIRMVAGPVDYTQGAMRNASRRHFSSNYWEPMSQGTRCHQLAAYVIFESPLNMLCDTPSNYMKEPECTKYISEIPTVWDETVGLDGKVGQYIAMARRTGDAWYVGALTEWTPRDLTLDLSFLPKGDYQIEIFKDGVNADRVGRDYKRVVETLPADRKVNIHLAPGGGWTAKITKK